MLNRRQILKASGAASAVLGSAGLGLFGDHSGKSPETYTGTYRGFQDSLRKREEELAKARASVLKSLQADALSEAKEERDARIQEFRREIAMKRVAVSTLRQQYEKEIHEASTIAEDSLDLEFLRSELDREASKRHTGRDPFNVGPIQNRRPNVAAPAVVQMTGQKITATRQGVVVLEIKTKSRDGVAAKALDLEAKVMLHFDRTPLRTVLSRISDDLSIRVVLDSSESADSKANEPITIKRKQPVSLKSSPNESARGETTSRAAQAFYLRGRTEESIR